MKASTVTRKSFHILASLVFITGIIFDVNLMSLAAGIGLGVLIFVEVSGYIIFKLIFFSADMLIVILILLF